MCVICLDYKKGLLTLKEVEKNLYEMYPDENDPHAKEIIDMVIMDELSSPWTEEI